MMFHRLLVPVLGFVLVTPSCTPSVAPLAFDPSWSDQGSAESYQAITRAWTRSATIRAPLREKATLLANIQATLRTRQWRNAFVSWQAATRKLDATEHRALLAAQQQQAKTAWEVALVVSTYHRAHNDLQKGDRSIWKVTLISEDHRADSVSIVRDRRPRDVLRAELLEVDDFAEVYLVRFPPDLAIEKNQSATLLVAGNLGAAEISWSANP